MQIFQIWRLSACFWCIMTTPGVQKWCFFRKFPTYSMDLTDFYYDTTIFALFEHFSLLIFLRPRPREEGMIVLWTFHLYDIPLLWHYLLIFLVQIGFHKIAKKSFCLKNWRNYREALDPPEITDLPKSSTQQIST